jgi:hypothetical protein
MGARRGSEESFEAVIANKGGASDGKWVKYRKSPGQGWPRRATNLYLYFIF